MYSSARTRFENIRRASSSPSFFFDFTYLNCMGRTETEPSSHPITPIANLEGEAVSQLRERSPNLAEHISISDLNDRQTLHAGEAGGFSCSLRIPMFDRAEKSSDVEQRWEKVGIFFGK